MSTSYENLLNESLYEQFEYRLVYLRPNVNSDERLTAGIIAMLAGGFELRLLSSIPALNLLSQLIGASGVEQFHFAAREFRRVVRDLESWSSLVLPTGLFILGPKKPTFTRDRIGFLMHELSSASLLMPRESTRANQVLPLSTTKSVSRELYHEVSLLNPMLAQRIFYKPVTTVKDRKVTLPILGDSVFGATVSLSNVNPDQKMRARAHVAKLRWLRDFLRQQRPKLYALAPSDGTKANAARIYEEVRELRAIANASEVELAISGSMQQLATCVVADEAA